ncbi:hypothetical protein FRX31_027769 [Thalictrum thalictroides]|uniref:Pentatricopeptide repeat-containing protein n=1 Tax=Thalictrum thalictroides TaxID=46969 RepID=A0A7J6VE92_THATH|nr:hypothetical protein FRX31_027769 [Thalictrum thalictroides]
MTEYANVGEYLAAVKCLLDMSRSNVRYDNVTFVVALCSAMGTTDLKIGQQIHCQLLKTGFGFDISVVNCLMNIVAVDIVSSDAGYLLQAMLVTYCRLV